jgi:hypothetical protein
VAAAGLLKDQVLYHASLLLVVIAVPHAQGSGAPSCTRWLSSHTSRTGLPSLPRRSLTPPKTAALGTQRHPTGWGGDRVASAVSGVAHHASLLLALVSCCSHPETSAPFLASALCVEEPLS